MTLSRDEEIRIAAATCAAINAVADLDTAELIQLARVFEEYIRTGKELPTTVR